MNIPRTLGALALAIAAALAGHWWGARHATAPAASATNSAASTPAAPAQRKIRFYRNPMGLPDTSPVPKKDPMGMDYIPVYEGEEDEAPGTSGTGANQLKFSAEKIQKMGVRTEPAALRVLDRLVRATGRVEPDERRSVTVVPRFEGYVEKLLVNATGQSVARGQPLMEVYAPDLLAAQREYTVALQGLHSLAQAGPEAQKSMQQLADASLARLRNWDMADEQIKELERSGVPRRTVTLRAPASGYVAEKKAVQGMRFMPGEALYQISDVSSVWVLADVAEQDIGAVHTGVRARVKVAAYPEKTLDAALTYVYPTLNAETRTVPVRLELANPGGLLKPGMFATVELPSGGKNKVLTVPISAVIDSGVRQVVLVQMGKPEDGRFEPREVTLGARGDNYLEVLSGVREGEAVVTAANFLIDAESNLKAAVAGFGNAPAAAPGAVGNAPATPAATSVGHQAQGKVVEVDAKALSLTISHGPVATLKWPAMTMDFGVANGALLKDLKPGAPIAFEFVERGKGEWVITKLAPSAPLAAPAAADAAAHKH